MEPLSWTGPWGAWLNPLLGLSVAGLVAASLLSLVLSLVSAPVRRQSLPDGTLAARAGLHGLADLAGRAFLWLTALVLALYLMLPLLLPYGALGILGEMSQRFLPVWIALALTFGLSIAFKRRLGLYGKLFDSTIGMAGFALVMFWVFTALFAGLFDMIATHDPLTALSGMKNKVPGTPLAMADDGVYPHYLLGGDNLARDVFSRMVHGSWIVVQIAPLATIFAFLVGITLGLPAGFYAGRLDTLLSFLANLILAFPVILLFYLLVTPEMVQTGVPAYMAMVLFLFPIAFFGVLLNARLAPRPMLRLVVLATLLLFGGWLYLSMVSQDGTPVDFWPDALDLFDVPGGILVVFVSVVFVNAPTVFRIVRGLTMDIKTRDYVAAAQTRGESPWYIMLWEILPNARGPLIVDFCLRIGYTTILLGTLGFFGLGLPPDSPDWGSTINLGRRLLSIYPHAAMVPALALLSLVLGLNLLADGLREESLRD
ncbi:peptide/nickel transport system permease protein [Limimaricola soesokkakensis]|uniref:Glutathione transport system permease protein GsiD n=1 Tax=Limimaricola soesokkakensis TaxID=1343159 RepID=A0A1X6ZHB0_9RHOB|nr:ABC transporter permease [Limimaricola soesokkakensis]PSK86043.1 peptide/nickel transport system permease protein [Limimaricola soesokkakensis]SLN51063.1 Glutathione transport system permease protein GsiD [Limimaricola soesokkakensis]